ncbi:unnamed protein product [Paramecium sonneborni]|uniref:Uncharacterized protein n=1 Tax=Paramecium sonneborni TaxID=65129 RepID=A0A8S1P012_9CILI|nr:unnamed protein product [Paramecium sonneborni]
MSIKVSDFLQMDRLQDYFQKIQEEEDRKHKIQELTTKLIEKSQKRLKLQNRNQRVDQRFNEKLKNMKELNTFIDVRQQIVESNLLNDVKLMDQIQTEFKNVQTKTQEQWIQKQLNLDSTVKTQKKQSFSTYSTKNFSQSNSVVPIKRVLDNTFLTSSMQNFVSDPRSTASQINNGSYNFDILVENGLLSKNQNSIKLTVSKYYSKYQNKTNEFIKNMKLNCIAKYKPIQEKINKKEIKLSNNNSQYSQHSPMRQRGRPQTCFETNQLSTQKKENLQQSSSENQKSIMKVNSNNNSEKCSNERTKNLQSMINFYQNSNGQTDKRLKTPQYRRRIGQSFLKFNKSLTEVESELNKSSQVNNDILKKMESIVNDVYEKYQTQSSFYNFY